MGQKAIPGSVEPPTHEMFAASLPRAVAFRGAAPGRAPVSKLPEDTVYNLAVAGGLSTAVVPPAVFGQKRQDLLTCSIRELPRSTDAATLLAPSLPAAGRLVEKIAPAIRQTRPRRQLSSRSPALQWGIGEILQNALVKAIRQPC